MVGPLTAFLYSCLYVKISIFTGLILQELTRLRHAFDGLRKDLLETTCVCSTNSSNAVGQATISFSTITSMEEFNDMVNKINDSTSFKESLVSCLRYYQYPLHRLFIRLSKEQFMTMFHRSQRWLESEE